MSHRTRQAASVSASLRYLENDQNLDVYVASVAGGKVPGRKGNFIDKSVTIRNGRNRNPDFSINREGFCLYPHKSAVTNFHEDVQLALIYDSEVRKLVKTITGANRVEVFDHTRRSASERVRTVKRLREPASTVHNDYTALSGIQRLIDHYADTPDDIVSAMKGRFAIVNVWRSIKGTVQSSPMALCDATTVSGEELIRVKREGKDRMGEVQFALWSEKHEWHYFPKMQMDEALLIKTYDSALDGRARFTIHTAFSDPNAPDDAPPRESMETRCFAFFS